MYVVFCTLFLEGKPHAKFRESLEACLPLIEEHGFTHKLVTEVGCPYISAARSKVLRKALDDNPDYIVYLDYDVSWRPKDMLKLLQTEGEVVAGTYRVKRDEIKYMGILSSNQNGLIVRHDGCIKAEKVPAGFLRLSRKSITAFALHYPELLFGDPLNYNLDLFNHGVINNIWHGEDYAFSHRWVSKGGEIWIIPDLDIDHWRGDVCYKGNFHEYLTNFEGEPDGKKDKINENVW